MMLNRTFIAAGKEGFRAFLPVSIGLIPWAIATGMAMVSHGLSTIQALAMNLVVYAGTAQMATLPLMKLGSPIWLIVLTALVMNLRFIIFSAAIAPGFRQVNPLLRWISGYLLIDGVFATCKIKYGVWVII
jgi:predicted branched-subunit amino acid permease